MSFTGAGPLGTFGWGTTTSQALDAQAEEISFKYKALIEAINHNDDKDSKSTTNNQGFPEFSSVHTGINFLSSLRASSMAYKKMHI